MNLVKGKKSAASAVMVNTGPDQIQIKSITSQSEPVTKIITTLQ